MPEPVLNDPEGVSTPTPESIRQALGNILASTPFATAARSRRFLSYVTEKTLAGEHDGIKELVLGIEVFDRANDFDPRVDTIVRVEAGKLRKRLQEYYEGEGAGASVRIDIPKGSYVAHFQESPAPVVPAPSPRIGRPWWKYAAAGSLAAALLVAIAAYWWGRGTPSAEPSVAVLPFLNFSSDPSNEYFADGLTEDLTDALARLGGMRVASRTSAFSFKGKRPDIQEVGAKLHAAFVVEGSVRKEGQVIKITAQLVRTGDGYHVWSNSFERDLKDVFAVQREITQAVAAALEQKLTGARKEHLARPYTANIEAFDLYMRGRHAAPGGVVADITKAEQLLQKASVADPAYPLPYVALADLYLFADILQLRPSRELAGKAKEAVLKALALDGNIAEAHAILGRLTARHEYDWGAAEGHLRKAIELDPNSATAHSSLAEDVLAPQGFWQEAETEQRMAMELDPLSSAIAAGQPFLQFLQRRYDPAIKQFQNLAAAHPMEPMLTMGAGMAMLGKADYLPAIEIFDKMLQGGPLPSILAFRGSAYARSGNAAEARKVLDQLTTISKSHFVSEACFVTLHIGLNDRDQAFERLERARLGQESFLIFTRVDGFFDPIRSDPRFGKLLAEVGLSDEAIAKNQALTKRVHR